jgi:uncharacterized Zn finger protein
MTSAFVKLKASRLLANGHVRVACVDGELEARVRGDHDTYSVRLTQCGASCSCPSWRRRCSHALAVERIVGDSR